MSNHRILQNYNMTWAERGRRIKNWERFARSFHRKIFTTKKKKKLPIVEIAGHGSFAHHSFMKQIEWYHIHPVNVRTGIGTITYCLKEKKKKLTK